MGDRTPDEIGALDVRTRGAKLGVASLDSNKKVIEDPASAGSGNGLDADKLDGKHYSELYAGPTTQISAAPYSGVTTTRAIGQVYQNTTGKPLHVKVVLYSNQTYTNHDLLSDSSNPPTTLIDRDQAAAASIACHVDGWIMPNNYFEVTESGGTPTLVAWGETH